MAQTSKKKEEEVKRREREKREFDKEKGLLILNWNASYSQMKCPNMCILFNIFKRIKDNCQIKAVRPIPAGVTVSYGVEKLLQE